MVVDEAEKWYREYLNQHYSRWEFGNRILYKMCEENPLHNEEDVVAGKIWLIGRSYAAAIERRKNVDMNMNADDFYYKRVAPKLLEIGTKLDNQLTSLKQSDGMIRNNVTKILNTHKYLTREFEKLTELNKRSLASKYLHFHCPDMFFIYDSRACSGINKLVKRPYKKILSNVDSYDKEYGNFVCKMLELQEYLNEKLGEYQKPRELDNFLLSVMK